MMAENRGRPFQLTSGWVVGCDSRAWLVLLGLAAVVAGPPSLKSCDAGAECGDLCVLITGERSASGIRPKEDAHLPIIRPLFLVLTRRWGEAYARPRAW